MKMNETNYWETRTVRFSLFHYVIKGNGSFHDLAYRTIYRKRPELRS